MKKSLVFLPLIVLSIYLFGCGDREVALPEQAMNSVAEAYVKLALAVGHYDDDYIDAYFGPAAWPEEVDAEAASWTRSQPKRMTCWPSSWCSNPRPTMRCSGFAVDS